MVTEGLGCSEDTVGRFTDWALLHCNVHALQGRASVD